MLASSQVLDLGLAGTVTFNLRIISPLGLWRMEP